jgi:hypothetical protein
VHALRLSEADPASGPADLEGEAGQQDPPEHVPDVVTVPVVMVGDKGSQYIKLDTRIDGFFTMSLRDVGNDFEIRITFLPHEVLAIEREWRLAASKCKPGDETPPAGSRQIMIVRPDDPEEAANT